ncbi:hypothetical protein [Pararhizobium arenae]|uniref:hypothetical protein n=1 Tax=Pararhizobium arenae TaxID=1856850 RepID=UPI000ABEF6E8|nr:hypothetical protein [Pararhizobium arenae]
MSVNLRNISGDMYLVSPGASVIDLPADRRFSLIVDLGVHWKTDAAVSNLSLLRQSCPQQAVIFLRIEGIPEDVATLLTEYLAAGVGGIMLSGCTGPAHLQHLETMLRVAEAQAGKPDGSTNIVAELGGSEDAFLPPRPLTSDRLSAIVFNEAAACAGIGTASSAIGSMRASTQLIAAQAGVPCYLLGDGALDGFDGRILRNGLDGNGV